MPAPTEIDDIFPLTPLQQGMLLHTVEDPTLGVYVNQVVVDLDGDLRADLLRQAWEETVAHHGVLRTAFLWEGLDEPLQAVRPAVRLPWTEVGWAATTDDEVENALRRHLADDRERPFALAAAPLMRVLLARVAPTRHLLVWTHHHLLLDGWSVSIVMDEVFARYRALAAGGETDVPAPRPYGDYVDWLGRQDFADAERHWRGRLAGTVAAPPPPVRTDISDATRFGEYVLDLPPGELAELRALCHRYRLTVATVVQGLWSVLLGRYRGTDLTVAGSVVAGRPAELDGSAAMVGLFSNTLPVPVRIDPGADVLEWLAALQHDMAEDRRYEYSPLARIQHWSGQAAGSPLFDTIVAVENYPSRTRWLARGDQARVTDLRFLERPHNPLVLAVTAGDALTLRLYVDHRRHEPAAARLVLDHLRALVRALLAAEPGTTVGELSMLTDGERRRVLDVWPAGPDGEPLSDTFQNAFAAAVAVHPTQPALAGPTGEVTYAEFAARVDRLARRLTELGVGPEVPVGICVRRSPDLAVALFGVVRAGGVVVPVDPANPATRTAAVLDAAGCPVVLVDDVTAGQVPAASGRSSLVLPVADDGASDAPLPAVGTRPDNLVYVIHTSGSTGRPKGVMATHRGVLNHLGWLQGRYPIGPGDRVVQRTSVSFDMSVWEVYWPLLTGACLVLPDADATDPERLATEMAAYRVTVASYVPSMLEGILADPQRRFPPDLRLVFIAGEALPPRLLDGFRGVSAAASMNGYGPTETSVVSVAWPLPDAPGPGEPWTAPARVPIGRPVSNVRGYVLDPGLRPVATGVPGELFVGGTGLARGYLNLPGLTAERFVPDPFGPPGARLYRTGDQVRWLPDGDLEYVGRVDFQVKVRGFRIEPGEIETALRADPAVRAAVVVARRDADGAAKLVAYLTAAGDKPSVPEMRQRLSARLPDYMVPAAFVWLAELPTTTSGKVDRAALPEPSTVRPDLESEYEAPRTDAERTIADIWSEVLRVDRVGVDDNFFELGGDSILSLLVVSRASRAGLTITPRQFFDHQTVSGLAAVAEPAVMIPDTTTPTVDGPYGVPLTPVQRWFFDLDPARPGHWNLGVSFAVLPDADGTAALVRALRTAVDAVVRRHEALRTVFRRPDPAGGPRSWAGWRASVLPTAEVDTDATVRLVRSAPDEDWARALAAVAAAAQEFDLGTAPLLRAVVVDGGRPDRLRLLLVAHHLVTDGVSWRVLIEDLSAAYAQARAGAPVEVPAGSTPPGIWAAALDRLAASRELADDRSFWATQEEAPTDDAFPPDMPDAPGYAREADIGHVVVALDAVRTRQLLREVPRAYRSHVDDALITAVGRALHGRTGTTGMTLDLEGHGREQHLVDGADLSRTVGWLTSIAPVRIDLGAAGADVGTTLRSVKEQLRAVPSHGLSYGVLRYHEPRPPRSHPAISFNYLGQFGSADDGGGSGPAPDGVLRLRPAPEPDPPAHHPDNIRPHLLDITGMTIGGTLRLTFTFGVRHHTRAAVAALAEATVAELTGLVEHCLAVDGRGYTPSDFPESGLDQEQLDLLLTELSQS